MAKNREPKKNVEAESGSSDYDEESGNSSDNVESHPETDTKKPSSSPPKKSQPPQPSSSEEESGSDSESDSDQNVQNVPNPVDDPQKSSTGARKPQSENTATKAVTPAKRPAKEKQVEAKVAKRRNMKSEPVSQKKETEAKDAMKPNKYSESVRELNSGVSADSSKKVPFRRLWSEDDEIVILKGMLEYEAKKRSSPLADIDAFLEHIKKNLHVDVNKTQLQDKIKKLKNKYVNNKSKGRNLLKPHEQAAYELSENVWGNEKGKEIGTPGIKGNVNEVQKTPTKKANAVQNGERDGAMSVVVANGAMETPFVANSFSSYGLTTEERVLRIGAELFEGNEDVEGAKEWKKLAREDMELSIKKLDVKRAQMRLVLDKLK